MSYGVEKTVEELAALAACEELVVAYTHLIDGGEASKAVELFTEDGAFVSRNLNMHGRDELITGFSDRERQNIATRHVMSNLRITRTGPDTAEGTVYLTMYYGASGTVPSAVAEYRDTFRRTDAGWRFADRHVVPGITRRGPRRARDAEPCVAGAVGPRDTRDGSREPQGSAADDLA